ncbi:MAG: amidohydrolase family protein [Actinomycetota bacterium]|nr:amidohydrolase family protein [Actinomycetota bacterium]
MATTVLRGGRVLDPGTGLDAVTDLLVRDGRVAGVGPGLVADVVVDVTGLLVGPGFVDLHSHVHSVAGHRLQALDGVTTALDLEVGLMPIGRAYAEAAAAGRPLNYGFSASWSAARGQVLTGVPADASLITCLGLLGNPGWQRSSTGDELARWLDLLRGELSDGALGIGIAIGYAPQSDPAEFLAVARLAAEAGAPTFTHVRELVESDPTTPVDGSSEVCIAAAETGAHMHHCHVNSTSRRHVARVLATLERSIAEGSRVTVEAYPYGAGSTGVGAFFLAPERLHRWGIGPSDIVLLPSGERIRDAARLREVREQAPGTSCVVEFLDETDPRDLALLERALAFPDTIVASDAMPVHMADGTIEALSWPLPAGGVTHPRTAGTFTRSLRMMVRDTGTWTWLEAFRRCSWLPARTLDEVAPAARAKGHLGVGADADIVVLDPDVLSDRATYLASTLPAVGVRHLFVGGVPVVQDGDIVPDALPGKPLRGEPR